MLRLREPFGKAGLVVAVVALVLALGGGAWALSASGGNSRQVAKAKLRASAAHRQRAARGARGPQGPAGPEGPEGPAGAKGRDGTNGRSGVNGTDGLPGKSVVSGTEPPGENCEQGGYWFELQGSGSKQYVCNGSGGGSGALGGTELAPGDTMTGLWSFLGKGQPKYWVTINFPLRAPKGIPARLYFAPEFPQHCHGTVEAPTADRGFLCIYAQSTLNAFFSGNVFYANQIVDETIGRIYEFDPSVEAELSSAYGTWALSAPCPIDPQTHKEETSC